MCCLADGGELVPEVGEGFAHLFRLFNHQVGIEKGEYSKSHGDAMVSMCRDRDGGTQSGKEMFPKLWSG